MATPLRKQEAETDSTDTYTEDRRRANSFVSSIDERATRQFDATRALGQQRRRLDSSLGT
jgi:hypothetical protein